MRFILLTLLSALRILLAIVAAFATASFIAACTSVLDQRCVEVGPSALCARYEIGLFSTGLFFFLASFLSVNWSMRASSPRLNPTVTGIVVSVFWLVTAPFSPRLNDRLVLGSLVLLGAFIGGWLGHLAHKKRISNKLT